MRIVLSRKGFDSVNGGKPSPILPDGTLFSLPIPDATETSGITYADINLCRGESIGTIVEDLTNLCVRQNQFAHLDPDLRRAAYPRISGWRPLFGQAGGDQTHLTLQGVTLGDVFLFFGWFRQVEIAYRKYRYVILNGVDTQTKGAGFFTAYDDRLRLTRPNHRNRTLWQLPSWFYPSDGRSPLSRYARMDRWKLDGPHTILDSVHLGQEFVFDTREYPEAIPWLRQLMT